MRTFFKDPYSFPLVKYFLILGVIGLYSVKAVVFILISTLSVLAVYVIYQIRKDLKSSKPYFKRRGERFYKFDIVIDKGSAIRPNEPGVLKQSDEDYTWLIVYDDGFEWCLSSDKKVVRYHVPETISK